MRHFFFADHKYNFQIKSCEPGKIREENVTWWLMKGYQADDFNTGKPQIHFYIMYLPGKDLVLCEAP
jgi:hypothetical protein